MAVTIMDTQIAKFLLDIKAVKLNVKEPFTWTSGIRSPIYCDCRIVNSYVQARDAVISKFVEVINERLISQTDLVAGIASGGISYGALIADRLRLPFIYVREKKKEHGLKKQIEGEYRENNKVLLIEDLISTGGSSMKAILAAEEAGLKISGLLSIMTYNFRQANDEFSKAGVFHDSLCNVDIILDVALERRIISVHDMEEIQRFRQSPKDWQP